MSSSTAFTAHAPWPVPPRSALHWVSTHNPFYVVSAGLFLAGIWITFDPEKAVDTWALMTALAGYTLLLAATAYLLVRHANVWDDARTVLLMVVLMFLATSVTFDRILVFHPKVGTLCNMVGLLFALIVSECLLRGMRLELPLGFRLPYYLLLGLFFLYPVWLATGLNLRDPKSEPVMWGMFGFAPLAGLVFLTLLPAVRAGAKYVADNGSPWPWPLYPWSLFGLLALAVPGRAILICYSMHLIDVRDLYAMTFGPYFLVPFGLALALLLLEAGLRADRQGAIWTALTIPGVLVFATAVGHHRDEIYLEFLAIFQRRLGVTPEYLALLGAACFYGYAAYRRVGPAIEALTASLIVMALIGDGWTPTPGFAPFKQTPLIVASTVQVLLGCMQWDARRVFAGSIIGIASLMVIDEPASGELRRILTYHSVLLVLLAVGALFDGELPQILRVSAAALAISLALRTTFIPFDRPPLNLPDWAITAYPLVLGVLLLPYGLILKVHSVTASAGLIIASWGVSHGWSGYRSCREVIAGLDYLLLSVAVFAVAASISLAKSGLLTTRRERGREELD